MRERKRDLVLSFWSVDVSYNLVYYRNKILSLYVCEFVCVAPKIFLDLPTLEVGPTDQPLSCLPVLSLYIGDKAENHAPNLGPSLPIYEVFGHFLKFSFD